MALNECRECGREVSTEAESCPQCGAPYPTKEANYSPPDSGDSSESDEGSSTGSKIGKGCAIGCAGLLAIYVLGALIGLFSGTDTSSSTGSSTDIDSRNTAPTVEVVSWNWRADPGFGTDGAIIYTVEVRNLSDQPIETVRIDFTTYDAQGNVVGSDYTFVSGLPPGGRKSTKSYATYYGTEEKARLQAEVY